jgi:hypothetical protein
VSNIGRILLIFIIVVSIIFLLSIVGVLPPGTGSRLLAASMLLTWLAVLSRSLLFRSMDEGQGTASAVFQGSSDGEWLPVLDNAPEGLWIRRMTDEEKRNFLLHLKKSADKERAQSWANAAIGWKGHCIFGVSGWKGRQCDSGELLPYSHDAVYSCCLRNPDLFAHYAGRLQKTVKENTAHIPLTHGNKENS